MLHTLPVRTLIISHTQYTYIALHYIQLIYFFICKNIIYSVIYYFVPHIKHPTGEYLSSTKHSVLTSSIRCVIDHSFYWILYSEVKCSFKLYRNAWYNILNSAPENSHANTRFDNLAWTKVNSHNTALFETIINVRLVQKSTVFYGTKRVQLACSEERTTGT